MHGVRKTVKTTEEKEAEAEKVRNYRQLLEFLRQKRKENDTSTQVMQQIAQLLRVNPDSYSFWNFRRNIILESLKDCENYDEKLKKMIQSELDLTAVCIRKNPKSYHSWHHRKWVVLYDTVDLEAELELCRIFLNADERNFHCWNYRQFIAQKAQIPISREFAFTTEKITTNFSNYSAFHYRSKLLPLMTEICVTERLVAEFEIVHQAVFTEPDDQSAWWYHQFLIQWAKNESLKGSITTEEFISRLREEINQINSLLEVEDSCKWALVTLASLSTYLTEYVEEDEKNNLKQQIQEMYEKIISLDPMQRNYFIEKMNEATNK